MRRGSRKANVKFFENSCAGLKSSAILAGFADKNCLGFTRNKLVKVVRKDFLKFLRNVEKSDVYCKASLIAA
jgi:hypothetical protein